MDLSQNHLHSDSDSPDFTSNHATTTTTTLDDLFATHGPVSFFLPPASFLFFINEIVHILGFKISRNGFWLVCIIAGWGNGYGFRMAIYICRRLPK